MAKKKSSINKSQAIRDYVAANPSAKPKEVAAALTEQHGVSFTPQAVSMTKSNAKKKAGKKPAKRGPKPKDHTLGNPFRGSDFAAIAEAAVKLIRLAGGTKNAQAAVEVMGNWSSGG